jgi:energy-converting hydrogenase A subunit M
MNSILKKILETLQIREELMNQQMNQRSASGTGGNHPYVASGYKRIYGKSYYEDLIDTEDIDHDQKEDNNLDIPPVKISKAFK